MSEILTAIVAVLQNVEEKSNLCKIIFTFSHQRRSAGSSSSYQL